MVPQIVLIQTYLARFDTFNLKENRELIGQEDENWSDIK